MVDYSALIPELPQWNGGRGIAILDWLGCMGSFDLAIGYTELFWPHFTERDGCIVRTTEVPTGSLQSALDQAGGRASQVEAVYNMMVLVDLHSGTVIEPGQTVGLARPEPTWEQLLYLGERLCEMWLEKLKRDFPDRQFLVLLNDKPIPHLQHWPQANQLDDLVVTAFQLP